MKLWMFLLCSTPLVTSCNNGFDCVALCDECGGSNCSNFCDGYYEGVEEAREQAVESGCESELDTYISCFEDAQSCDADRVECRMESEILQFCVDRASI